MSPPLEGKCLHVGEENGSIRKTVIKQWRHFSAAEIGTTQTDTIPQINILNKKRRPGGTGQMTVL